MLAGTIGEREPAHANTCLNPIGPMISWTASLASFTACRKREQGRPHTIGREEPREGGGRSRPLARRAARSIAVAFLALGRKYGLLPSLPFHPSSRVGHFGGPSAAVREAAEMASGVRRSLRVGRDEVRNARVTTPSRPTGKGRPSRLNPVICITSAAVEWRASQMESPSSGANDRVTDRDDRPREIYETS